MTPRERVLAVLHGRPADKVLWINFPSSVHLAERDTLRRTAREIVALARQSGRVIPGITEDIPADRWQANLLAISEVIDE